MKLVFERGKSFIFKSSPQTGAVALQTVAPFSIGALGLRHSETRQYIGAVVLQTVAPFSIGVLGLPHSETPR